MKITTPKQHLDAIKKTCIEMKFDFQVHENENEETVSVWIRDQQFGELSPVLAFWLGVSFRGNIETELWKELLAVEKHLI
jgi:branched-subunit amino acid aminotransferase/4-amino-4-deoxychorismate lyase